MTYLTLNNGQKPSPENGVEPGLGFRAGRGGKPMPLRGCHDFASWSRRVDVRAECGSERERKRTVEMWGQGNATRLVIRWSIVTTPKKPFRGGGNWRLGCREIENWRLPLPRWRAFADCVAKKLWFNDLIRRKLYHPNDGKLTVG